LVPKKEADAKRQRDKATKRGAKVEEKDGRQENGKGRFQPLRMEQRGERFPNLIEDDRHGKEEAAVKSYFEEGKEGLRNAEGNQVLLKVDLKIAKHAL